MEMATKQKAAVISVHLPSMQQSAQLITSLLRTLGFDVWMCGDLSEGIEYREEVDRNFEKADVIVMMLNNHWSKAEQFKYEYQLAQQNKKRNKDNIILPIAFSDIKWHPALSSCTDFICHDAENLLSGNTDETLKLIKEITARVFARNSPMLRSSAKFGLQNLNLNDSISSPKLTSGNLLSASVDLKNSTSLKQSSGEPLDKQKATELYESVFGTASPHSLCRLAQCHLKGSGTIEKDTKKAIRLYEKAAANGSVVAAYNLAYIYEKGKGVSKNLDKAEVLYSKAAAGGNSLAKKRLQKVAQKKIKKKKIGKQTEILDDMASRFYVPSPNF